MRSPLIKSMLLPFRRLGLVVLLILQTVPITARPQEIRIFTLPTAATSSLYQVNIEQILRENYGLKLLRTAEAQSFRWYFYGGALPLGLRIMPSGNIVGRPRSGRAEPYRFKVKVLDASGGSDELVLMFELKVEPSRIQLVSTNAPRLVPLSEEAAANENAGARVSLSDRVTPSWNSNHFGAGKSSEVFAVRPADNTRDSIIRLREREAETNSAAETRERANVGATMRENDSRAASVPATGAAPAVASSCPACEPSVRPNSEKDFIIDARTGTTQGKRRFKLHENARIIIINKNPFLYQYRVTFKEKPIEEPAIAKFFEGFPLFAGGAKAAQAATTGPGPAPVAAPPCPQLRNVNPTLFDDINSTPAELEKAAVDLDRSYKPQQEEYDRVAQKVAGDKEVLYNQNTECPELCKRATSIRTTLEQYQPKLDELSEAISNFKGDALQFQRRVKQLEKLAQADPQADPATHPDCAGVLKNFSALAAGYVQGANDLETGVKKMIAGKKTFDEVVKIIDDVFSHPDAFQKIYFSDNIRKEFNLPADIEITVERKEVKAEDTTFVKLVDAETINFGGGARFAMAGGVVVSPLETINFKRVSTLVNGQPAIIVGRDESSNSRILPILILHGRFAEGKGPISGFHFSLGITAKPTDSGTNVEFLLGPSISFIEERLFFTFGGYAGRQKQLEGNLVQGQVLPKEFGDDIPTSNHLVWKPGIALTYKFK